jgi:hypothetical protein
MAVGLPPAESPPPANLQLEIYAQGLAGETPLLPVEIPRDAEHTIQRWTAPR